MTEARVAKSTFSCGVIVLILSGGQDLNAFHSSNMAYLLTKDVWASNRLKTSPVAGGTKPLTRHYVTRVTT